MTEVTAVGLVVVGTLHEDAAAAAAAAVAET